MGAYVISYNIADFSADVFNDIKVIIDDGSDNGSDDDDDTFSRMNNDDEDDPSSFCGDGNGTLNFRFDEYDLSNSGYDENDPPHAASHEETLSSAGSDEHSLETTAMGIRIHSLSTKTIGFESEEGIPVEEVMDSGSDVQCIQDEAQNGEHTIIKHDALVSFQTEWDEADDEKTANNIFGDEDVAEKDHVDASAGWDDEDNEDTDAHIFDGSNGSNHFSNTSQAPWSGEEGKDRQKAQRSATRKGKAPQKGSKGESRFTGNAIFSVIMDKKKPGGPPKFYRCKIASCNGFQGVWAARQRHFAAKHPDEWEEVMGRPAIVFPCEAEGCDWTTANRSLLAPHIKKHHPGLEATQRKK